MRVRGIVFDLLAQPANVDCDRTRVERSFVAPDAVHELVAGEHLAWMAREKPEKVEFLHGQAERAARLRHLARSGVDREVPERQLFRAGSLGRGTA